MHNENGQIVTFSLKLSPLSCGFTIRSNAAVSCTSEAMQGLSFISSCRIRYQSMRLTTWFESIAVAKIFDLQYTNRSEIEHCRHDIGWHRGLPVVLSDCTEQSMNVIYSPPARPVKSRNSLSVGGHCTPPVNQCGLLMIRAIEKTHQWSSHSHWQGAE